MELTLEKRIRERAYALWLAHGCIDGQAEQHWLAAEREMLALLMATPAAAETSAVRKLRNRHVAPTTAKARASAR